MLNIQKHKDEILKYAGYQHSLMCLIYENIMKKNDCTGCCSECKRETIKWLTSEYKEPILTDKEKTFIKNIIKAFEPFGDEIERISKHLTANDDEYYLVFNCKYSGFNSPIFTDSELFKNMKLVKDYTLEELGL